MSQSTVLILGARGRLGSALVEAFAARGWRVLAQARRAGASKAAATIIADVLDMDRIVREARDGSTGGGVDVVVNTANPPYTRWAQEAVAMNDAAIAIARTLGATLMLPGNVYNYGADLPAELRPDTPQQAKTKKGKIRIAMERSLAYAAAQGTQAIVIRAGDFFGCGVGSWFDQAIAKDVPKGKVTYPGPLDLAHAWAYVPDLAATFVRVAEARQSLARFENIHFAGYVLTGREFVAAIERAIGRPMKVAGLPWPLLRVGGLVVPMWRELAEMAYLWRRPHRLVTDAGHAQFMATATPFDVALRDSLVDLYPQLRVGAKHADESGAPVFTGQ